MGSYATYIVALDHVAELRGRGELADVMIALCAAPGEYYSGEKAGIATRSSSRHIAIQGLADLPGVSGAGVHHSSEKMLYLADGGILKDLSPRLVAERSEHAASDEQILGELDDIDAMINQLTEARQAAALALQKRRANP